MQHFWLGDHESGWNWVAHDDTPYGDGDSGTPGVPNPRPKMDIIPLFKNGFEGDSP